MNDAQVGPDGCLWAGSMVVGRRRPAPGTLVPRRAGRLVERVLESLDGLERDRLERRRRHDVLRRLGDARARGVRPGRGRRDSRPPRPRGRSRRGCPTGSASTTTTTSGSRSTARAGRPLAPTGERVATVRCRGQATSCCFAGDDLDVLVITSGARGSPRSRGTTARRPIFAADVGVRGVAPTPSAEAVRRALVTGSARGIGRAVAEALPRTAWRSSASTSSPARRSAPIWATRRSAGASRPRRATWTCSSTTRPSSSGRRSRIHRRRVRPHRRREPARGVPPLAGARARDGERGWGRIVNVSSIGARDGRLSHGAAYAASKAGVIALTRSFARPYGGVRRDRERRRAGRGRDGDDRVDRAARRARYLADILRAASARRTRSRPRSRSSPATAPRS